MPPLLPADSADEEPLNDSPRVWAFKETLSGDLQAACDILKTAHNSCRDYRLELMDTVNRTLLGIVEQGDVLAWDRYLKSPLPKLLVEIVFDKTLVGHTRTELMRDLYCQVRSEEPILCLLC